MFIRRIVASALAAAALTGGVGIAAIPNAVAQPDQCDFLTFVAARSQDGAGLLQDKFGPDDIRTKEAWKQYTQAYERADAAGCY